MFLNQLEQDSKKELFLFLATLVMMASGSYSENLKEDTNDETMKEFNEIKDKLSSQDILLKHLFDNIQATEAQMLKGYMQELNHKYWVRYGCSVEYTTIKNLKHDDNQEQSVSKAAILGGIAGPVMALGIASGVMGMLGKNRNLEDTIPVDIEDITITRIDLVDVLRNYSTQVMTESILFEEKESDKNLPYLLRSGIRLYVLKNAASVVIKGNPESLSIKERKIILTELIGAGFSSGHFEEEEKELVKFIGSELGLDNEYFDEITEVMEKVFHANRELTELVNE